MTSPPSGRIGVELVDQAKDTVVSIVTEYGRRRKSFHYCDLRLEVGETRSAAAENGLEKAGSEDYNLSFGVRVLAGKETSAPGYFGQMLGSADLGDIALVLRQGIDHAYRRALANAEKKAEALRGFPVMAGSLLGSELAPVAVHQVQIKAQCRTDPRAVPLAKVVGYVRDTSRAVKGLSDRAYYNVVVASTALVRELFCSSQGAVIDQSYALTEGMVFAVCGGKHGNLELYDTSGHLRGWEVIEEGYHSDYIHLPDLSTFATTLARDTLELADAPPLKPTENEVVVVTDPHFNALICHEVVGHPSELDRALKMETSYAGRSWLFESMEDNQIGKQVASPLLSAFSDPTMEGFGHYLYDHEGTPARRVWHIKDGVYQEFLNSRQTAAILGVEPNGSYKATDASMVPLIRMSNTAFAPGSRDPAAIIKEVSRGYYVVGHRIPSVAESRENFRISAMKVYEIRNGELGQLYRDGGIMSDSRDFFMRVDAAGNDFRLFPIPNCGKGQPMQTKRMGNGGPTLRSVARLTGGSQ